MAKNDKKIIKKNKIVYDYRTTAKQKKPIFKPGDKPYCRVGMEMLNGKIPWPSIIHEVINTGRYTMASLASELNLSAGILAVISEKNDTKGLDFRTGAHLLAIHARYYPECF